MLVLFVSASVSVSRFGSDLCPCAPLLPLPLPQIWWPATAGTLLKLVAGVFGAFAFRLVNENGEANDGCSKTR